MVDATGTLLGHDSSDDVAPAKLFGWVEYLVFGLMLTISAVIGLYYGCTGRNTTKEFLTGGKSLGVFPVAASLTSSFISAITLLGQPTEVYTYGAMFWMVGTSYPFMLFVVAYFYMPVFYNLQLTSANEYLELRFSRNVRLFVSAIFMILMTTYMAITVYAPSLALNQVTGLNLYGCVVAMFAISTFYTTMGGLKAVVWTNAIQLIIMIVATTVIVSKGVYDVGGPRNVWRTAEGGGRLTFINFDPDPRTRHTLWGLFIGNFFYMLTVYGCSQAQVQRYLSLPTMRKAQWALFINGFGLFGVLTLSCYAGLVIYTKYSTCDPLFSKKISRPDQLFPLFVIETVGDIPGLPGLFVASVFSATLSIVSIMLNSLAIIALEDFIKGFTTHPLSDTMATNISKILAIIFALTSFSLVFLAEHLGQILTASISISGTMCGPILGLFTLGMFFPWCSSKGAIWGALSGLVITIWIWAGAQVASAQRLVHNPKLPVGVDSCELGNLTAVPIQENNRIAGVPSTGVFLQLYRMSYIWYPCLSCCITIFVGLITSFLTGCQDVRRVNPKLISPGIDRIVRIFLPQKLQKFIGWLDLGVEYRILDRREEDAEPLIT